MWCAMSLLKVHLFGRGVCCKTLKLVTSLFLSEVPQKNYVACLKDGFCMSWGQLLGSLVSDSVLSFSNRTIVGRGKLQNGNVREKENKKYAEGKQTNGLLSIWHLICEIFLFPSALFPSISRKFDTKIFCVVLRTVVRWWLYLMCYCFPCSWRIDVLPSKPSSVKVTFFMKE